MLSDKMIGGSRRIKSFALGREEFLPCVQHAAVIDLVIRLRYFSVKNSGLEKWA